MHFASDNASGVPPQIMAALASVNDGPAMSYGHDAAMDRVRGAVRVVFEAPEAAVYLVTTGTAANSLALATLCPPWGAVFCHDHAHVVEDECGAPVFFSGGAALLGVSGDHGRIDPEALKAAIARTGGSVHGVQKGALSITNVTEAGTVYTPAQVADLTAIARGHRMRSHMDGARFANALVATGATPAEMTWRAGIDVLSFGGTKNGLLGVEGVIFFDPARAWEFELRRKRSGHLMSKHRYLSAQMEGYLEGGLWLRLASHANAMAVRLARGLGSLPGVALRHPVEANILFPEWLAGTHARLEAAGAVYYPGTTEGGRETARLVTSWSTTEAEVDAFLSALAAALPENTRRVAIRA